MDAHGTEPLCSKCGRTSSADGGRVDVFVSDDEGRVLCGRCWSGGKLRAFGSLPGAPDFEPMSLSDANGVVHRFEFFTHILPESISIQALEPEKKFNGYHFVVVGEPETDPMDLFRSLYERMRRALAQRHLVREDGALQIVTEATVRARIEIASRGDKDVPRLIIDGRPVSWKAFGDMLMRFCGSQFKLEIYDLADDMDEVTPDRSRRRASERRDEMD